MIRTELQTILTAFYLSVDDLARALSVSNATLLRWMDAEPSGLAAEVLRGLHRTALEVAGDDQRRRIIGGRIALGIGAVIHYGLVNIAVERQS